MPAGERRRITVRLTRRGFAALSRDAREFEGSALLLLRAVAVDPAGRSSVLEDALGVELAR